MTGGINKLWVLACLWMLPFSGCLSDGGTEIPNEVRGTLYTASGTPAANALVRLYPVNYAPGDSANAVSTGFSAQTNASGRYSLKKIPAGEYNLVASGQSAVTFQDSILLTSGARELPPDTLRAPGSLTATVRLQPQHSPQTATVQVLGTQYYSNVAADGHFTLALPQGIYRLRVATILPEYTPLFVTVTVISGVNDTLSEPLEPFYSGIPVVTGLKAAADSSGALTLTWKRPVFGNVQAYLIYRDSVGTIVPSTTPYKSTTDTIFRDTIYGKIPKAGQYGHLDTVVHAFNYRVRILDVSDNIGPVFGSAQGTPLPLAKTYVSGRWHRALENAPFGQRLNPSVVAFNNVLWLFGGGGMSVWSTADGIAWQQALDSLPLPAGYSTVKATVHAGKIWLLAARSIASTTPSERGVLLSSADGTSWSTAKDSLLLMGKPGAFLTFRDTLWAISGGTANPVPNYDDRPLFQRSADGFTWTAPPRSNNLESANPASGGSIMTVFADKVWVAGGRSIPGTSPSPGTGVMNSLNGSSWVTTYSGYADGFLPRAGHALVPHAARLWSLGGRGGYLSVGPVESIVWSSQDGVSWNVVDFQPFSPRDQPAAVSFNGRLWVIGGIQADGTNDIWYYE